MNEPTPSGGIAVLDQDEQQLQLLSIFHYVVSGITALCSLFPVIHLVVGLLFLLSPEVAESGKELPHALLGWIFVGVASTVILLGLALAGCILAAGRCLARRSRYVFCLTMAGIECLLVPFGTVLGVFTIIVLTRDSVKQRFLPAPASHAA